FLDLPEAGGHVQVGDEILELESSKAVEPLVCPVAGTVVYVNRAAADDPAVINSDPYGEGWILKIELDDDQPDLLDADEYAKLIDAAQ
ncbi:glycine cleavage system protein H, partial [Bifidobacterium aemilianum]